MATIDDKVVAMSFESSKFESGVNKTLSSLDKLKAALHFPNAGKGLDDINAASKRVDLSHISNGVGGILKALDSLRLVAIGVFAQLTTQAVRAGATFVKSFTLGPLIAGFKEYSTNLNSIQTILANTQASGANLQDVNKALDELNEFSDKTIYNFSQMAKNIGTFTAAGVDLDTSTQAIKGIANLAALSGSNADQASSAMYQLSQAISAGRVGLMDWNSVVNAGMGGTVFQRALATTAENMGTLKEGTLKLVGPMKNVSINGESFRQSMQAGPGKESWLTSKVLTNTLKQFTGDLTDAQLKAEGFNDAQIKAIQQTAVTAQKAATEVKTIGQVFDVAKETAGSGWAQTFRIIFGDFEEAKTTFTALSETINGFINTNADARNKVLGDWKALGGRTVLIEGIKNVFEALGAVIKPLKEAFRDIFPATTGKDLFDLTVRFKEFTETLKPSPETIENLRRTFAGLFAIMDIGKQIVQGIFTMFGKMFGALGAGQGGFLNFTAAIGDWLVKLDEALKKGDGINKFFSGLGDILAIPIKLLGELADALGNLFGGFSSGGFSGQMDGMTKAMTPFQRVLEAIGIAWENFIEGLGGGDTVIEGIVKAIQGFGPAISNAISNINFEAITQVIRTGLFAGLVLLFKNFFGKGSFLDQIGKGFAGGILSNISGSFSALEGSMKSLQTNIKADTLKKIAIAIGILAASVVALSFVDPDKLKSSLTAITVMFGQLLGAMAILEKITASTGFLKLPIIAGALILLAGAIDILAIAVFALSKLSWDELLRGLTGVGGLLAGISAATIPLSANSAGMVRAGIGIGAIAVSMNILALAMKQFAGMSWQEIAKGLAAVAGALVIMAGAARVMPTGLVVMGVGLIAIATSLRILSDVLIKFGNMNWKSIGKGLLSIGGALVVIAGAMQLMPTNVALTAAGLLLVSFALGKIADAVIKMGGMSIKQIAKGLGTLAGALVILAGALYLMSGTLGGAVALTVAATGISLLAGALTKLGGQSWEEIIKSLVTLGAALAVLAAAALALSPVIPAMLGLGAALVLIGAGLALAGAGVFLIGAGLSAVAVAGPAAVGILLAALSEFEQALVETAKNLILGLLEIVEAFSEVAPKFVDALVKIIDALLDVIIKSSPKIAEAFTALMDMALKVLHDNQKKIIQAGFDLILALLQGIKNNIPQLVTTVIDIIVRFLNTIENNLRRIIDAGVDILIALVKGISQNIANIAKAVVEIIVKFIEAIGKGHRDILNAGVDVLVEFIKGLTQNISDIIDVGTDFIVKLVKGIGDAGEDIITAAREAAGSFIKTLAEEIVKLSQDVFDAVITLLNGLATTIEENDDKLRSAGMHLGWAIINGMTFGLAGKARDVYNKAEEIAGKVVGILKKVPLIGSPSKVTTDIGENIILGLVKGLDQTAPKAYDSAEAISNGLIKKFSDIFEIRSPSQVMIEIGKAVGQGFAQGLRGSQDDIVKAFAELNNTLLDAMADARETIASEQEKIDKLREEAAEQQAKLNKLRAEKKPDADAIKNALDDLKETGIQIREIQAVITENENILERTTAGHKAMITTLKDEKRELFILAGDYERISKKLELAQQALDDIRQARRDIIASTTAQFATRPELDTTSMVDIANAKKEVSDALAERNALMAAAEQDAEAIAQAQLAVNKAQADMAELMKGKTLDSAGNSVDQLATYEEALLHQTKAIGAYNSTLQQLRELGINDATFKKLVDDGVADQAFANQLLAGGRKAVEKLNKLDKGLQTVSNNLGTNVGKELFDSGVKAAKGLVDGLDEKKSTIYDKMREIADEMVRIMNNKLKIKSPSQIFAEIGKFSMEGLALGFTDNTKMVTDVVDQVAKDTMTAMQKSMRNISGAVLGEIDANPVITPILDLSLVRTQSRELTALTSYGQASMISAAQNTVQTAPVDAAIPGTAVKFEQNNYSPTALTEIEIYRMTKNQLSQFKSALALT